MRHPPIRPARTVPHSTSRSQPNRRHDAQSSDPHAAGGDAELARCRAEIAKLLPLWPRELADLSPAGRAHVIAALERALRAERRRGLAGHWTYNLARHVQLLRAYRLETAAARANREQSSQRARAPANPEWRAR